MAHPVAKDIVEPMGWTSENIVKDFNNVTRAKMVSKSLCLNGS